MDIAQEIAKVKVEDEKRAAEDAAKVAEEAKAKKRAEIMAKVAAARLEQEQKELEAKVNYVFNPNTHHAPLK
jgi:hypothetical protein